MTQISAQEGYAQAVLVPGKPIELLAATVLTTASATSNSTAVAGLQYYSLVRVQLTISAKSMAAGTVNIYIQGSIDGGTNYFDIVSFTQITTSAMANGKYRAVVNAVGASVADGGAAQNDGALTAASVASVPFGDRLRVKVVPASLGANDTVTIAVCAWVM